MLNTQYAYNITHILNTLEVDAAWLAVDQRLVLWIFFTLSDSLIELIMGGAVDAYMA